MRLSVIIVTYNNSEHELKDLDRSLSKNGIKKKDIYFSDNSKKNKGYGGGINKILGKIFNNYESFFIINPDVVVSKGCINKLIKTLKDNKDIGIVGPKILDNKGKIWSTGGNLDKKRYSGGLISYGKTNKIYKEKILNVDFISGTAMLIRKEVFEAIGLFQEDYFLYYEDVDFCIRAKKAGFRLAVNPKAEIVHFASTSVGKDSSRMQYYLARNHMWLVERFGPLSVKFHELLRLPKTLLQARNKKYELLGILDFILGKKGYKNIQ